MAELDPLVARVLLKGDDEFLSSLNRVGEKAADTFEKLSEKVSHGASAAEALTGSIGLIEGALAGATAALVLFIEQQTELSQKTELLANAFGVTTGQLQDIEATFASAGVKVEQFERFANRLTITIAREWPQIAQSIKTYANENDSATLRVSNAILRIRDAQNALSDNSEERASKMAKDNDALEASYTKLQFAAVHAASEQRGAQLSVEGAVLSVTAAQQHLAELQGNPPTAGAKAALALDQAQLAVDNARKSEDDARIAQQEKAAGAALKARQIEQEYSDLARKASKDARDDAEQRVKDENAVKEAIIARGEAEQRAAKLALTSVASIRDALDGIAKGNKDATSQIDLAEVSVQHLTQAIIAQAAETTKNKNGQPSAYETMISLSKTLAVATDDQISQQQRLAVVNRLAATGMTALGGVGAELLHVLEHDSVELQKFNEQAKALDTADAKKAIEDFRGALAGLNLTISILSQRFAIAVSPAFTAFLRAVQASLEDSNGVLHTFIAGLDALGSAISTVGGYINEFVGWVAKMFDTQPAAIWKGIIVAIGVVIAATATALLAWPIIIATVITAVGYLADNWEKVKKGVENAWEAVKDSALVKFLTSVLDLVTKIWGFFSQIAGAPKTLPNSPGSPNSSNATPAQTPGLAGGGQVHGPGTTTSDSVLARLSRGEFVVKAAAVQNYGASLFHALNNMQLPGFATGGLVPSPVRLAGGGAAQATSTLNLSLDGRSFNGFRGPKSTVDELSSFAIARQTSAAGNNPSWMK